MALTINTSQTAEQSESSGSLHENHLLCISSSHSVHTYWRSSCLHFVPLHAAQHPYQRSFTLSLGVSIAPSLEKQVTRYFTCDPCTPGTPGWEAPPEIANTHRTVKSSVRARFSRICSAVQLIWSQPPATKLRAFDTFAIHLLDAWAESVQNTTCRVFQRRNKTFHINVFGVSIQIM